MDTALVTSFVSRALRNAAELPPAERADHFDFAATLLGKQGLTDAAAAAADAAAALREAEAAQLAFTARLFPSAAAIKAD